MACETSPFSVETMKTLWTVSTAVHGHEDFCNRQGSVARTVAQGAALQLAAMATQDGAAAMGADAGKTRSLPSHLRYVPLSAEVPPEQKRAPSTLAAELKGSVQLLAPLVRPRIIGLLNMADFTHNVESIVPLDEPIFQPSPPEVVFDKFEPFQKYTTQIRMRNNDNVNRRIKILKPESTVFSIEMTAGSKGSANKVAPGMEVVFKVHFAPRAAQDYYCELVCLSEREKFVVAVSARGPRACFDFPDGVDFGLQPVRGHIVV